MIAVMIIWMGIGNTQTVAITRFQSMQECQAAKSAISSYADGEGFTWGQLSAKHIHCVEVHK